MKSLSRVRLLSTPWTAAHQAPPSMGCSRQESWSGVPLLSPIHSLEELISPPQAQSPALSRLRLRPSPLLRCPGGLIQERAAPVPALGRAELPPGRSCGCNVQLPDRPPAVQTLGAAPGPFPPNLLSSPSERPEPPPRSLQLCR